MYAGRIMETGPVRTIFRAPRHAYTQALLRSVPATGKRVSGSPAIAGAPPEPRPMPPGCRFAPRCTLAMRRLRRGAARRCVHGRRLSTPPPACAPISSRHEHAVSAGGR